MGCVKVVEDRVEPWKARLLMQLRGTLVSSLQPRSSTRLIALLDVITSHFFILFLFSLVVDGLVKDSIDKDIVCTALGMTNSFASQKLLL